MAIVHPTQLYMNLESNFLFLKELYLDDGNVSGVPTPRQQEMARAFCVFLHAEFESYFEGVCENLIQDAIQLLNNNSFNLVQIGMVAYSNLEDGSSKGDAISGRKTRDIKTRLHKIKESMIKDIDDNHGISQKYLSKLFVPLGLTKESIDPTWVAEIDDFASTRGIFAHKTRATPLLKVGSINPIEYLRKAERIIYSPGGQSFSMNGIMSIKSFDEWACAVSSSNFDLHRHRHYHGIARRFFWKILACFK
jgi:hypothetical protein